jgi:glycosyltransferase involved in cell wall biosynthesis
MSGRPRVAYLLTQDRGGPVDVTVRLAATLVGSGMADVRVFGPTPARDAELLEDHHEEITVPHKGDMAASRRTRAALRAWRPDVVHAQDRRASLVSAGLRSTAVVHTYHGVPDDVGEQWFRGIPGAPAPSAYTHAVLAADALVARKLDRTVVPAPAMGRFLADRLRVPANRLTQIDNCVAPTAVRLPSGPVRRLVFAGLLVARKGVLDLLTALSMPGVMPEDARLTVIGDGPQRSAAEALAHERPLRGKVEFLGFRADVPDLLLACDALVLPSSMEQQPLVVAEAMAAGKPVVATDTGGVADMVGPSGYLVQPGDVPGLADRLRALFADPDPAGTGQEMAARAQARFTPEACARRHLELYEDLLG